MASNARSSRSSPSAAEFPSETTSKPGLPTTPTTLKPEPPTPGTEEEQRLFPAKPAHRLAKYFDREKGPLCFQCKNWGHIGAQCPKRTVLRATAPDNQPPTECVPALYAMGEMFDTPVRLLLDSGADHSIVSASLLKQLQAHGAPVHQPTSAIALTGVHGDTTSLPVISLSCKLLDAETKVPMAISSEIGHDIILGRNCTALYALMRAAMDEAPREALPVQTRRQAAAAAAADDQLSNPQPLDDLIGADYDFPQTNLAIPDPEDTDQTAADEDAVIAANAADQKADASLTPLWQIADQPDSDIVTDKGVLHRRSMDQTGEPYLVSGYFAYQSPHAGTPTRTLCPYGWSCGSEPN